MTTLIKKKNKDHKYFHYSHFNYFVAAPVFFYALKNGNKNRNAIKSNVINKLISVYIFYYNNK